MKKSLLLVAFSFLICLLLRGSAESVQAVPNETIVSGKVTGYGVVSSGALGIEPEQTLHKLTILVESTGKVPGRMSLIEANKGESIEAYSKAEPPGDITGKKIKVRASVAGDERGRMIWIKKFEEIN